MQKSSCCFYKNVKNDLYIIYIEVMIIEKKRILGSYASPVSFATLCVACPCLTKNTFIIYYICIIYL